MRAPEPVIGVRVVAPPADLDRMWTERAPVLRFAADEALVLGDTAILGDGPGIGEMDHGFVGWWLTVDELAAVRHHVEWPIPEDRPALAQGLVAGVPARLWLTEERALLLVAAAYAHELQDRLP